jgi:heat shock protein HslJ
VDGTTLVVDELAMTEMACQPAERMDQDTWLAGSARRSADDQRHAVTPWY